MILCKKQFVNRIRPLVLPLLAMVLCLSILFTNASCTMFLAKEGYKEIKKLEEEHKEKEEKKKQQERSESSDDADSTQPRHHGTWTPQQEE